MELSELVELVKKTQGTTEWDVAAVIRVGGVLAAKVNTLTNLSGKEKGKLVADALKAAFDELEKKEALMRRIDEAAKVVPLEQLCLSPQCGFSSTVHGNNIAVEDQRNKLRLVIETAQEVWGAH